MLDLSQIHGVIFDLDGTLVESSLDFTKMRDDVGCPQNEDILAYLETLNCEQTRQKAEAVILAHELEDAENAKLLEIGETMLNQVAQANLPTAIVTRNCRQATKTKLSNNNIDIELVITREDAPAKPDPTALLQIAKQWDIAPKNLLYVGDYIYDKQAAENAEMQCFLV